MSTESKLTEEQKDDYAKRFAEAQQQLLDSFKEKLKTVADVVLSDVYTDVSNFAAGDAYTNYHNLLRDEAREEFRAEIVGKYGQYSWAHGLRMLLLEHHKAEISNKIIEDLQETIVSLKSQIEQIEKWRR